MKSRIPLLLAGALLAFHAYAETTIVTRAGKGSPLTANEVDANFTNLKATADGAVTSLAGKAPSTSGTTLLKGDGSGGFAAYGGTSCTNQFVRSLSTAGAATCATVANTDLSNSAITIAGTSTSLGGSITLDAITGLSTTGLLKRTGSNTLAIASGGTDYENPLTFAARLNRTGDSVDLATSGVSAGSCTNCDLTIDTYGRVTVKGNGSSGGSFSASSTDTLTNKTYDTAGTGNSFSINGVAVTANTGTGAVVRASSPALTTPDLGTPTTLVATNATGTASGLTAGHVTTNANMTGDVTSSGNATTLATVNSNVGTFGSTTKAPVVTVNAKGLVTAVSEATIAGSGSGTVTNTGGNLTNNAVVLGAGTVDTKVVAGVTTDGTSALNLGVAGTSVGKVVLANATSGTITLSPPTGALGTVTVTIPARTGTMSLGGQGTSFPGSPASGDRFFRTDLGLDCYYDGTRWLTAAEYSATLVLSDTLQPYTVNGNTIGGLVDGRRSGMFVTDVAITTFVSTTNNGSNYWSLQLNSVSAGNVNTTVGSAQNTSADTLGNFATKTYSVGGAVTSGHQLLRISLTKTGAPGSIYVFCTVWYRAIVT